MGKGKNRIEENRTGNKPAKHNIGNQFKKQSIGEKRERYLTVLENRQGKLVEKP